MATPIWIPRGIPRPRPGSGCVRGSGSCRHGSLDDAPSAYSDIPDSDLVRATLDRITLDYVVEHITVPYPIAQGANDRQIPVADAHRSYEQATGSPKRAS